MNTKTMRLPPRRVPDSMPNKRKERDSFDLKHLTHPPPPPPPTKPPPVSNKLLAGYLAHEFITRGTLFGQPWNPTRPQQTPVANSGTGIGEKSEPGLEPKPREEKRQRYVEVANLLKSGGAHVPGIVNPNQLSRFLEM